MASFKKKYPDFHEIMSDDRHIKAFTNDVRSVYYEGDISKMEINIKRMLISENVAKVLPTINLDTLSGSCDFTALPFDVAQIVLGKSQQDGMAFIVKVVHPDEDLIILKIYYMAGGDRKDIKTSVIEGYCNIHKGVIDLGLTGNSYKEDNKPIIQKIVALCVYMVYGDITTKTYNPSQEIKLSKFKSIKNNITVPLIYVNTLWKQRVNTTGFKVIGHWRLQACGIGMKERKLIWIEAFSKNGYNRKATKELINE